MSNARLVSLLVLAAMLSACGSSGSSPGTPAPNPSGNSPAPAPIEGIALPSSVSVVTATNAN